MGSRNKEILHWFDYRLLVNKSDSELNEKTIALRKWTNKRLKSDRSTFSEALLGITRNFMRNFLHYLEKESNELDMKLDINSFNGFILRVKMGLSKLQKLFVVLEQLYDKENIHIQHHSIGIQLMISFLGHEYYRHLYEIISCQLKKTIDTVQTPDNRLITLCQYFSDIGFDSNYRNMVDASWIPKENPPPSRFILEILKKLVMSFDISKSILEPPVYPEERLYLYMEHLNNLVISIYPEECFSICRMAYLETFANLSFYKSLVLASLSAVNITKKNDKKSERIIQEEPFSSIQLANANLEITTRWLHKLMKENKNQHDLILRMLFLLTQEKDHQYQIMKNYQFVLRNSDVPRFMKLLVRHILLFHPTLKLTVVSEQDSSQVTNSILHEKEWIERISCFLQNYHLMQPFVNTFFEQYILKNLIKGTITLESIKSALRNNSFSTTQLQRFYSILKHNHSTLNKTKKLIINSATTVTQYTSGVSLNSCISLPEYLFPSISMKESVDLPFSIPSKWLVSPSHDMSLLGVPVKFQNQPHLQRVLVKPWNLEKTDVLLDLNLFHAIILDTFFNERPEWLLSDMIKGLEVKNVSVFRHYLSSLVNHGILIQSNDSCYSLNLKFEPNAKLLKKGIIIVP